MTGAIVRSSVRGVPTTYRQTIMNKILELLGWLAPLYGAFCILELGQALRFKQYDMIGDALSGLLIAAVCTVVLVLFKRCFKN